MVKMKVKSKYYDDNMTKTMMIKMSAVEGDLSADDLEINVITNTTTRSQ